MILSSVLPVKKLNPLSKLALLEVYHHHGGGDRRAISKKFTDSWWGSGAPRLLAFQRIGSIGQLPLQYWLSLISWKYSCPGILKHAAQELPVFSPVESDSVTMMAMPITDFCFHFVWMWQSLVSWPNQRFSQTNVVSLCFFFFFWQMIDEVVWNGSKMEVLVNTGSCFSFCLPPSLSIDKQTQGICHLNKLHDNFFINAVLHWEAAPTYQWF